MTRARSLLPLLGLAAAAALGGCAPRTTYVIVRPEPRYAYGPPPAPAPQVMVAEPQPYVPPRRVVIPASPLTEEQRTELLREAGSPIRPYAPAPPPSAPVRTVVVEREVVRDPYWRRHYWQDAAAIGAGFALVTMPFWGPWGWRCWGD